MNVTLQEHAVRERRRAFLHWRHEAFTALPSGLPDCFDAAFAEAVLAACAVTARTGCESGIAFTRRWGVVVAGTPQEILQSNDPCGEYFTHLRRRAPLAMIHTHPSKRLGLSRSDCLTADIVVRESAALLPTGALYLPIFGVAVECEGGARVVLVQRRSPGLFMNFSDVGQAYDADSWLACPAYNAAVVKIDGESKRLTVIQNTGLAQPLR